MAAPASTRLGPYEIVSPIGKGGMGEVWRAHDPRLGRDVAIKLSKAEFSERFKQEARLIAQLNHPHICTLHDVGPNYLVMELVDGAPLVSQSKPGPLPVEKAVEYAGQILDALDAAHRKGITHRDLKPANILVTKQGIKLLDFGLAKQAPGLGPDDLTIQAMSAEGQISGTLQYMSPEQLQGKKADARSDIFSFGCVLYEMLSGTRAFGGSNAASIIAAVLEREPETLQTTPPLDRVIRTCLAKDPDDRFQNARDAKRALLWAMEGEAAAAPSRSRLGMMGWIAAGVATIIAASVSFVHFREKPPETPIVWSNINPPEKTTFRFGLAPQGVPTLSPDGRRLVFGGLQADGSLRLWLRPLDSTTAQPLTGTEGASGSYPFWSPDGRSIGFSAGGKLKKIDLSGGPAISLADMPSFRGASWSPRGVIVFAPRNIGPLQRVAAAGGSATPVTTLDAARKENSHRWPWFLPDGRHFLYASIATGGSTNLSTDVTIYAGSLDSSERRIVAQATSNAIYASGYLLFLRDGTLMAQPFDAKRLVTMGEPVPVAERIGQSNDRGFFAVSDNGAMVIQPGALSAVTLTWLDRTGKRLETVGETGGFGETFLSPDGKRAAVTVSDASHNFDLWIYDLARNLRSRFTFGGPSNDDPVWSPDGSQIIFDSNRKGHSDLYRKPASGAGAEELLYADGLDKVPTSWSRDGKFVTYTSYGDPKSGNDVWVLPLEGDRKPYPFLQTSFIEMQGQFSPDGHRMSYTSNESGRNEIYIAPFPGPGGKRLVSVAGGSSSRWRADGKELFYTASDGRLMAAEIGIKGAELEIGTVRPLFGPMPSQGRYQYDVSADGQRIFAVMPNEQAPEPLTLVQNWTAGLKK